MLSFVGLLLLDVVCNAVLLMIQTYIPKPKFQLQKRAPAKSTVVSLQTVQTVHSACHDLSESVQTSKPLEQSSSVLPDDNPNKQAKPLILHLVQRLDLHAKSVEEASR